MNKNSYGWLAVAGFLCVILALTSPNKSQFTEYISTALFNQIDNKDLNHNPLAKQFAKGLTNLFLDSAVQEKDYVLFKVFAIDLHLIRAFNGGVKDVVFIGIAGQFIPLNDVMLKSFVSPSDDNGEKGEVAAREGVKPDPFLSLVGKHPSAIFEGFTMKWVSGLNINNKSLPRVKRYFDVASEAMQEGNFIIGEGCIAHMCGSNSGIWVYNMSNSDFFIGTVDENGSASTFTSYTQSGRLLIQDGDTYRVDRAVPNQFISWLSERGFPAVQR